MLWVGYAYVGYPMLIGLTARLVSLISRAQGRLVEGTAEPQLLPEVTVLIAAYNAEQFICERVRNIFSCDYPVQRLKVVIASDGSTDQTVKVVQAMGDSRVRVFAFAERRGKARTLAAAIEQLDSEVILFTDASTKFEPNALWRLLRHFGNPKIGLATGHTEIVDQTGKSSESLYWRCETMVRRAEAKLGIMLGASGAIYAMRRRYFVDPETAVINDDLVLPTLAHVRHGFDFVLDETAKAIVWESGRRSEEFRRRVRIGAGAFQSIPALREMFQFRHAKSALAFASHKLARWLCPVMLLIALLSTFWLAGSAFYRTLFFAQLAIYSLAILAIWRDGRILNSRVASAAASFLMMNAALLVGIVRWSLAPHNAIWTPTRRPLEDSARFTASHEMDEQDSEQRAA